MSNYDEFCINNKELCIWNKELCIKNKEFCFQNDEFCRKMLGQEFTEAELRDKVVQKRQNWAEQE